MDAAIRDALRRSRIIDITTTGRHTGRPRRIEIAIHPIGGRLYISGMPSRRTRAWIHNLAADPRITIHLKGDVRADLPGRARVITDPEERRPILERIARIWRRTDVDTMVAHSPLIEVVPDGAEAAA
jgi:deazaflavin-dependent oxidoreductase (nitroreductase family)